MVTAFNSKSFNTFSHSLFHLNDNLGFGLYIFSIGYRRGLGPGGSSFFVWLSFREAAKKVLVLMAGPLRKKNFFFNLFFQRSKISMAINLEGGGGLGPIKRRTNLRFPKEL